MYSSKLSVSIHILVMAATKTQDAITSDWIAGSIGTNPVLVRRLLSSLKKAGILQTQTGLGVTGLARPIEEISLFDIFTAVEAQPHLFNIHSDTNHDCPIGAGIEAVLQRTYQQIQTDFERNLKSVYLSEVLSYFK